MAETVTVSNELPGSSGPKRPDAFVTRLIPLDRDDDPVRLPWSPRGHQRTASPNWSSRGAVGASVDVLDWENSSPDSLSVSMRLQAESPPAGKFTPAELFSLLRTLETWATQPTQTTGRPTRVVLEQGAGSMSGVLDQVQSNIIDKTPDGLPKTAELSITIREQ